MKESSHTQSQRENAAMNTTTLGTTMLPQNAQEEGRLLELLSSPVPGKKKKKHISKKSKHKTTRASTFNMDDTTTTTPFTSRGAEQQAQYATNYGIISEAIMLHTAKKQQQEKEAKQKAASTSLSKQKRLQSKTTFTSQDSCSHSKPNTGKTTPPKYLSTTMLSSSIAGKKQQQPLQGQQHQRRSVAIEPTKMITTTAAQRHSFENKKQKTQQPSHANTEKQRATVAVGSLQQTMATRRDDTRTAALEPRIHNAHRRNNHPNATPTTAPIMPAPPTTSTPHLPQQESWSRLKRPAESLALAQRRGRSPSPRRLEPRARSSEDIAQQRLSKQWWFARRANVARQIDTTRALFFGSNDNDVEGTSLFWLRSQFLYPRPTSLNTCVRSECHDDSTSRRPD